jgi:acyl carrier protein
MSDPLILRLKTLVITTLKLDGVRPEEIPDDEALIDALELVLAIEREFGVKIGSSEESRRALGNIATLAAFIRAQQPGA